MLLMLDYGIYFEFIEPDLLEGPFPPTKTLEQVRLDTNYAVIISTNAGLWRYLIGDTIRFTSLSPYRFRITGRTKHYINAFGEELIIDNAEYALNEACHATAANIKDYTAAPVFLTASDKGGHEWLIEFAEAPNDLERFITVLDESLRKVNSDYDAKRHKDLALLRPKVAVLPTDSFYNWMRHRGKLGGQNKVPRLANDRHIVDALLAFVSAKED
jgi:hypothetical protein